MYFNDYEPNLLCEVVSLFEIMWRHRHIDDCEWCQWLTSFKEWHLAETLSFTYLYSILQSFLFMEHLKKRKRIISEYSLSIHNIQVHSSIHIIYIYIGTLHNHYLCPKLKIYFFFSNMDSVANYNKRTFELIIEKNIVLANDIKNERLRL